MKIRYFVACFLICSTVVGCAGVRQQDLDAWAGKPVEALDTHSFFLTLPMVRTVTSNGVEIRNYVNQKAISSCQSSGFGSGNSYATGGQAVSYANFNSFNACSSRVVGCNNLFYIKKKKILEYKPVGRCYTNEMVQPEADYLKWSK